MSVAKTTFRFYAPEANEVKLAGDFNGWQPQCLKKAKSAGYWETSLSLKPGQYQYKFVVDGDWRIDPSHGNTVPNSLGTINSLIQVG
jgi:1,4-alpha-glucan branching enzyme